MVEFPDLWSEARRTDLEDALAVIVSLPGSWEEGAPSERLMLDYAFTVLGLHNIMLRVCSYNEAGLRAYQKAGFREFGRRLQSRRFAGRHWDEVYMQCLVSGRSKAS